MDDVDENAAMVNAIQRRSTVIAQKSLAEGFGLTATEAMWKSRPVIAGDVGGLKEQVVDGVTGRLIEPDGPRGLRPRRRRAALRSRAGGEDGRGRP